MSWKTINILLGLAATDPAFFQLLRNDPRQALAAHSLDLTSHELAVLQGISATTLDEFSRQLIEQLGPHSEGD